MVEPKALVTFWSSFKTGVSDSYLVRSVELVKSADYDIEFAKFVTERVRYSDGKVTRDVTEIEMGKFEVLDGLKELGWL